MRNIYNKAKANCQELLTTYDSKGNDNRPGTFRTLIISWCCILLIFGIEIVFARSVGFELPESEIIFGITFIIAAQIFSFVILATKMQDAYSVFMTAQYLALFLFGSIFTAVSFYSSATLNFSLNDELLIKIDSWMGFDWFNYVKFVAQYPKLQHAFDIGYSSMSYAIVVAICALVMSRNTVHLQRFAIVFFITLLATIFFACVLPAVGFYVHFNISPAEWGIMPTAPRVHEEHLLALRNGSMHSLPKTIRGIVTFPSFHAAVGIMLIWAFYPVKYLRYFMTVLNMLLIVAAPFDGGHYLIDVIGGLFITFSAILFANYLIPVKYQQKN